MGDGRAEERLHGGMVFRETNGTWVPVKIFEPQRRPRIAQGPQHAEALGEPADAIALFLRQSVGGEPLYLA